MDGGRPKDKKPHNNLEKTLGKKGLIENNTLKLDAIILTHPDCDHMGGINRLLEKFTINCPIITTEAAKVTKKKETREIPSEELDLFGIELKFPIEGPKVYRDITKIGKNDDSEIKINDTSILFAAGKIQLTGDSRGKLIHKATGLGKIENLTKDVTVFQVPHHGSGDNSFVPYDIKRKLDKSDPLYELKINNHPAYREALFYRGIQAKTYFISFGDKGYDHPYGNVITGIIIAAVTTTTTKKKCKIVVTASFSKDKIYYPDETIFPNFPQNWKDYVDIFVPKDGEDTPYITITGDGEVVVDHTKPWVPESPR